MLYKHQKEAIRFLISNPRAALYHEQGLGKTITTIIACDYFLKTNALSQITVICPAFLQQNWKDEVKKWSKFESNYRFFSYEKFSNLDARVRSSECLVIDEAHYIKNRKAKRTQIAINEAINAKRVILLTGTPIGNGDILDLYTHLVCLNPSNQFAKFRTFYSYFMQEKRHPFDKPTPRPDRIQEFMNQIEPFSERKTKIECLDLPEKIYTQVSCKGSITDRSLHVVHRMQLQDGYPIKIQMKDDNGNVTGEHTFDSTSEKLKTLFEVIDCIPNHSQVVVYCSFIRALSYIQAMFNKHKINSRIFSGNLSLDEKQKILNDFKENKFRILIATMQSLNVGVTLTNCSNVIYYSRTFSVIERIQSEDRFHRIGQRNCVNYIDIIASGIDARAYQLLKENKTYDDIILLLKNF